MISTSDIEAHAESIADYLMANENTALLVRSPGSGATMIAKRVIDYMPPLSVAASKALDDIYDANGTAAPGRGAIASRPFRAPHYSISEAAMYGTAQRVGEISLAQYGVLFMDEMNEFYQHTLDRLCPTLAAGKSVVGQNEWWPAETYVIGAMLPCPCGYWKDSSKVCSCSAKKIAKHFANIPTCFQTIFRLYADGGLSISDRQGYAQPSAPQTAAHQQQPKQQRTEREKMRDFFFGKPGSRKARGLNGLPSWDRRRK